MAAPPGVLPSALGAYPDPASALARLQGFRAGLHACLTRRADALVDLADALLSAQGPVWSLPHLSLEPATGAAGAAPTPRWPAAASTRAAAGPAGPPPAGRRRADLRGGPHLLAALRRRVLAPARPVLPPSRHLAGQPIVAGWAFQWICRLGLARDSWTAPVDARRLHPLNDTDQQAACQVRALLGRLPAGGPTPWFVFDVGYDSAQPSLDLAEVPVVVLVRLRADRCLHADPPPRPPGAGGRPRRHGAKFAFADPTPGPPPPPPWPATTTSTAP